MKDDWICSSAALKLQGGPSAKSLSIAAALLLGCGISASSMNYYSRRYVGELALLAGQFKRPQLRISVLDFWGHRQASQHFANLGQRHIT